MEAQLKFEVTDQILTRTKDWKLMASESENYLRAKFVFNTDPWVPGETTAVFTGANGVTKEAKLSADGECVVPKETLTAPGTLAVSLYYGVISQSYDEYDVATDYTALRVTTNPVLVNIYPTLPVFHSGGES